MRYPEGHKEQTRAKILEAAGAVFRRLGYVGGGVGTVMSEAGMTKGGFYAHFESKEDLFAHMLESSLFASFQLLNQGLDPNDPNYLHQVIDRYLSPQHLATIERGCPLPALLPEVARAGTAPAERLASYLRLRVQELADHLAVPANRAEEMLLAMLATCVGGLSLARALPDGPLAERLLESCRALLHTQLDQLVSKHLADRAS